MPTFRVDNAHSQCKILFVGREAKPTPEPLRPAEASASIIRPLLCSGLVGSLQGGSTRFFHPHVQLRLTSPSAGSSCFQTRRPVRGSKSGGGPGGLDCQGPSSVRPGQVTATCSVTA